MSVTHDIRPRGKYATVDWTAGKLEEKADVKNVVPTTRKINSKPLNADISLSAADVGAVPTARKINNKPLNADISLAAADVGAQSATIEKNIPTLINGWKLQGEYEAIEIRRAGKITSININGTLTGGTLGSTAFNIPASYNPSKIWIGGTTGADGWRLASTAVEIFSNKLPSTLITFVS